MIPREPLTMFNMTKGVLQGPRLLPARRCCVQSMRAPCWCSCWEPPTWGQTTTWDVGQRTRSQEQNTEQRTADFGRIESPNQLFDRVALYFLVLCHKKSNKLVWWWWRWYESNDRYLYIIRRFCLWHFCLFLPCPPPPSQRSVVTLRQ